MIEKKLSVIFPVRVSSNREYLLDNIERVLSLCETDSRIEYILVDSGSIQNYSSKIKAICEKKKVRYIYQDTQSQIFSAGLARDYGAQLAIGKCLLFVDVDIVFDRYFFDKILQEIDSRELATNITEYFCVPCFYLSEEFSREVVSLQKGDLSKRLSQIRNNYDDGLTEGVINFAPATSLFVVNRHHFLSIGGHRKEFSGHGFEDFELAHRLATYANKHHRTRNYYLEKKNYSSIEYEGFRAYFSLPGYSAYKKDLFVAHIWHSSPKDAYRFSTNRNKNNLQLFMKEFDQGRAKIQPLQDLTKENITLILGKSTDKLWSGVNQLLSLLGVVEFVSENDISIFELESFLRERQVTRLLFSNPYGNEQRLSIYNWARGNNFPYLVLERGALPDSWFLDKGFNADSSSYGAKNWNKALSIEETIDIEEYINSITQSSNTLEMNNNYKGGLLAKQELDITHSIGGRKILLVVLQRPNDTVIKYFSGGTKNFERFIVNVNEVVQSLNKNKWFVIVKKHPLEKGVPTGLLKTDNMLVVNDEYHIHDLLYVSDKVLLINSGVGLLASLFEKPVIHMGDAFYSHPELNRYAKDSSEAVKLIESDFHISTVIRNQFIHYLRNKFYSFAKVYYSESTDRDGSKRTISESFDFYQISGLTDKVINYKYRETPIPLYSSIYGRFAASIDREKRKDVRVFVSPTQILEAVKSGGKIAAKNSDKVNKPPIENTNKVIKDESKKIINSQPSQPSQPINGLNKNQDSDTKRSIVDKILLQANSQVDLLIRKRKKFKKDPYNFFGDSKNPIINKGRYLYKNKKI